MGDKMFLFSEGKAADYESELLIRASGRRARGVDRTTHAGFNQYVITWFQNMSEKVHWTWIPINGSNLVLMD